MSHIVPHMTFAIDSITINILERNNYNTVFLSVDCNGAVYIYTNMPDIPLLDPDNPDRLSSDATVWEEDPYCPRDTIYFYVGVYKDDPKNRNPEHENWPTLMEPITVKELKEIYEHLRKQRS